MNLFFRAFHGMLFWMRERTLNPMYRCIFATFVFLTVVPHSGWGQHLSFTDNFGDGIGHPGTFPGTSEWDNGDVVNGHTWIIPFDDFGSAAAAAKRDGGPLGGTGNNIAGRLRTLSNAAAPASAAINLATGLDVGTLNINDIGDGTGRSGLKIRLLNGSGTVALEVVVKNSASDPFQIEASQVVAGTFVIAANNISWRGSIGANLVINFDARVDTFDAQATDTGGSGPVILGTTAFDNAVDRITRLELECFLANGAETNIGSEVSFESIVLTGDRVIADINLSQVQGGDSVALEFLSQSNITYQLESTTDLVSSNSFTDTGAYTLGTGANIFIFDPAGFSTSKVYRVRVSPTALLP